MTLHPPRAQEVFLLALDATDAAARRQVVERECGEDDELRRRVEALLSAHDATAGFGDEPSAPPFDAPHAPSPERPGTVLGGRFKLLEQIGEGGMGSVWVAEQTHPVRRKVAVKLVKAGMDSRQVLARFEAERQALALMDHPNIAKVLDGGLTDHGRPFFAMEYVKGVPLTEYCDQVRLSLADRLRLFIPVCQAVQHAHQKGIIHRDLKPSNILVCLYDGKPVPKVIDFGLAKAMHQSLTEHTLFTAHGMMVGTPLYMSPEQAEYNNLDVDTRTDIYSLGVLLYELLTGSTPLERARFKNAALNEILKLIKEVEPPKPSTRLSGSASLPSIAAQRSIDPRQLHKSLSGDLDWIVMKALDKERSRRYETANGLARDIDRFLNDEAIEARPPSASYRLRKLARKHRTTLAISASFLAVLLGGASFGAWQALRAVRANGLAQAAAKDALAQKQQATEERDRKDRALAAESAARAAANAALESVEQARRAEESRAEELRQVADFQAKMLSDIKTSLAGGRIIDDLIAEYSKTLKREVADEAERSRLATDFERAVRQVNPTSVAAEMIDRTILRPALEAIDKQFADLPLVDASLRESIARVYHDSLSNYEAGERLLEQVVEIRRGELGAGHRETLRAEMFRARLQFSLAKMESVIPHARSVLARSLANLGPDDRDTIFFMRELANFSYGSREALPLARETYELARRRFGDDDRLAIDAGHVLVYLWLKTPVGAPGEKVRIARKVLEAAERTFGPDDPLTLKCSWTLVWAEMSHGEFLAAEQSARRYLEQHRRALGDNHVWTEVHRGNLAVIYSRLGRMSEAETEADASFRRHLAALGASHVLTRDEFRKLTDTLVARGRYAELLKAGDLYLRQLRSHGGEEASREFIVQSQGLAQRLRNTGLDSARIRLLQAATAEDEFGTSAAADDLFEALLQCRRQNEARELLQKARENALGPAPTLPGIVAAMRRHLLLNEWERAEELAPRLHELLENSRNSPAAGRTMLSLAAAYRTAGRPSEGLALLERAWEKVRRAPRDGLLQQAVAGLLAWNYRSDNRPDDARRLLLSFRSTDAPLDRSSDALDLTTDDGREKALSLHRELQARGDLFLSHELHAEALADYEAALRLLRRLMEEAGDSVLDRRELVPSIFRCGVALLRAGRHDDAERLLDEANAIREELARERPRNLVDQQLLVHAYKDRGFEYVAAGRPESAEVWFQRAIEAARDVPETEGQLLAIANSLRSRKKTAEALALLEKLKEHCLAKFGWEYPVTLNVGVALSEVYEAAGRDDASLEILERVVAGCGNLLGPDHPTTYESRSRLATVLQQVRQFERALPLLEALEADSSRDRGPTNSTSVYHLQNLIEAYVETGRNEEARALVSERLEELRRTPPSTKLEFARSSIWLARALLSLADYAAAESLLRPALETYKSQAAEPSLVGQIFFAAALAGQQKFTEAEPLLLETRRSLQDKGPKLAPASKRQLARSLDLLLASYRTADMAEVVRIWEAERAALLAGAQAP